MSKMAMLVFCATALVCIAGMFNQLCGEVMIVSCSQVYTQGKCHRIKVCILVNKALYYHSGSSVATKNAFSLSWWVLATRYSMVLSIL